MTGGKDNLKISVVTACFNSSRTIRETIESVQRQGYANFEHIVVDGGSTDGTLQILKEYPHLTWISEKDRGIYDAMNKGIKMCSGDIVSVLNSDDYYSDGVFVTVGSAFLKHPDWGALFGDTVFVDATGQEIYRREEACYDYNVLRFSGICYIIHPTLFVRRAIYEQLGYYRQNDFVNCCDYEFILQLGRHGYPVGHVPKIFASFRIHEYGQTSDLRVAANIGRESERIMKEHGRPNGWRGAALQYLMRAKRQLQKLIIRGSCDLVPAHWILRKHRRPQSSFATNSPAAKF
jgi:glycosyltransferase involved in cell wall biosynthesis